jgi:hypothetical protein
LREESQQQRGHIFEGRRAQIPRKNFCEFWAELFFYCGRPYCTDPYSPHNPYRFGMEIEAVLGTVFEADFRFLFAVSWPYGTVRTVDCWHGKQGTEEVIQQYRFGMFFEAKFIETILVL